MQSARALDLEVRLVIRQVRLVRATKGWVDASHPIPAPLLLRAVIISDVLGAPTCKQAATSVQLVAILCAALDVQRMHSLTLADLYDTLGEA